MDNIRAVSGPTITPKPQPRTSGATRVNKLAHKALHSQGAAKISNLNSVGARGNNTRRIHLFQDTLHTIQKKAQCIYQTLFCGSKKSKTQNTSRHAAQPLQRPSAQKQLPQAFEYTKTTTPSELNKLLFDFVKSNCNSRLDAVSYLQFLTSEDLLARAKNKLGQSKRRRDSVISDLYNNPTKIIYELLQERNYSDSKKIASTISKALHKSSTFQEQKQSWNTFINDESHSSTSRTHSQGHAEFTRLDRRLSDFVKSNCNFRLDAASYLKFLTYEDHLARTEEDMVDVSNGKRVRDVSQMYNHPNAVIQNLLQKRGYANSRKIAGNISKTITKSTLFHRKQNSWRKFIEERRNLLTLQTRYQLYVAINTSDTKQAAQAYNAIAKSVSSADPELLDNLLPNVALLKKPNAALQKASDLILPLYKKISTLANMPKPLAAAQALNQYIQEQVKNATNSTNPFALNQAQLNLMPVRLYETLGALGFTKESARATLKLLEPALEEAQTLLDTAPRKLISVVSSDSFRPHMKNVLDETFKTEQTFLKPLQALANPTLGHYIACALDADPSNPPFTPHLNAIESFINTVQEYRIDHQFRQAQGQGQETDQKRLEKVLRILASPGGARYFEGLIELCLAHEPKADRNISKLSIPEGGVEQKTWDDLQNRGLDSVLITPIQHGPRWSMLLEDIQKNLPDTHPQKELVAQAAELAKAANQHGNECLTLRDAALTMSS